MDIEGTLSLAIDYIDRETRIIEGEKIQSHLNKHLDKEFNKYFYISLLKAHASGFGKQYYFIQNLISSTEIDYTGLSDICREALDRSSTRDDAFEFVNQRVCVHKHVLSRCFNQSSLWGVSNSVTTTIANESEPTISTEHVQVVAPSISKGIKATEASPKLLTKKNIESSRILIGQAIDNLKPIYWEYGNKELANRHLIVFGCTLFLNSGSNCFWSLRTR